LGFYKSDDNPNIYIKVVKCEPMMLLLYVDDLFLMGVEHLVLQYKREFSFDFDMKDIGLIHYYFGLEIW